MSLLRPFLISLLAGFALASAPAALIPAARLAPWTPGVVVGVTGGIPLTRTHLVDVTQAPYNADSTGTTDCHDAVLAAINAAQPGDIVYLPAGQYLVAESIAPNQGKSNYTIRGAGDSTRILWNGTTGELFFLGSASDYQWKYPAGGVAISGGLAQGSTVLTVANTSNVIDGGIIQIAENNDPALPVIHVAGYANARTEKTLVLSHTATTITISPGLYWTLQSGLNPVFNIAQFQSSGIGVENLMIDASAGTAPYNLFLEQCYGCWIYNVHSKNASNYHVFLDDCLQCQVDHCNLDQLNHTGTNGAGLLVNGTSASLFQNNIIYRAFPHIEVNFGSCGNVFAYNFCYDSGVYGAVGASIDSNHGPHNSYNLYEGNIAPNVQCDGYFGSTSEDTIFRNWLHGTAPGIPYAREPILLQRFTRNYSVVGNLLGTAGTPYASISGAPPSAGGPYSFGLPNIGNSGSTGTAQLSLGLPWADWNIVGTLASATGVQGAVSLAAGAGNIAAENASQSIILSIGWAGGGLQTGISSWSLSGGALTFGTGGGAPLPAPGTAVQIWPGPPGYQEKDLDVQATLTLKDNYDIYAGGEPAADQALGSDALPNSLYLSAPPPWFGNLAWPPFNPASPNSAIRSGAQASGYPAGFQAIPAGYRYVNGQDPPGTVLAIASAPVITAQPANQAVAAGAHVAFSAAASGNPAPTFLWQLSTDGGATWANLSNAGPYSGVLTANLAITGSAVALNNCEYRCVAINNSGAGASSAAILTVSAPPLTAPASPSTSAPSGPAIPPTSTPLPPGAFIQPASQSVNTGADLTLSVSGAGEGDSYQWLFNEVPILGATDPSLNLPNIADFQGGNYTAAVTDATGAASSVSAAVTLNTSAHLVNLSSLVPISADSPVFSAGFVVDGSSPRQILIRSVGPTLGQFGVAGALAAPQLVLFDDSGNTIATNTGWGNPIIPGSSPAPVSLQPATVELFGQVGAFSLPAGSGDCAIVATLPPGAYTVEMSGENAATGMALEEVYDTAVTLAQSQVCNMSARSLVGLGNQILVAGFIIAGTTSDTVLIRGLGPALVQFGISGVLDSPELILYDKNSNIVATNTGWSTLPILGPAAEAGEILAAPAALMDRAGAIALPADSADSALIATLPPGSYSAQIVGADNGTGSAMLEIYELR